MAVIDIPTAETSMAEIGKELNSEYASVIFGDNSFPDETADLLHVRDPEKKLSVSHTRVLLPRVFPVFSEGDMPSMSDLELTDDDALSIIKRLEVKNFQNPATYSHSLNTLYSSSFFSLWLKGVFADRDFFSGIVTTFNPHQSAVYADCYGSMLVARRIGWDIFDNCCNNPYGEWKDVKNRCFEFNQMLDRNLTSLDKASWHGENFIKFLKMPKLELIFPHINEEMGTVLNSKKANSSNGDLYPAPCASEDEDWLLLSETVNAEEWGNQIALCYSTVPTLNNPAFFIPDTYEQMEVKKQAALVVYKYLKKMFNALSSKRLEKESMFKLYRQFCNCLRTFHAITIHLKVKGFTISNKTCITSSCPLGKGGKKWRVHHKLERLSDIYSNIYPATICSKNSPEPSPSVLSHFRKSDCHFHRALGKYVAYCSENLPKVTQKELLDLMENRETISPPIFYNALCLMSANGYDTDAENVDYENDTIGNDDDTSDTQALSDIETSMSKESGSLTCGKVVTNEQGEKENNESETLSVSAMEVDTRVDDSASNAVSSYVSNVPERPTEFVTTTNILNVEHNSPITQSSCVDAVDSEILSHTSKHTGHIQRYPRHKKSVVSAEKGNWSNTNWVTSDHKSTWGPKKTIRFMKIVTAVLQRKIKAIMDHLTWKIDRYIHRSNIYQRWDNCMPPYDSYNHNKKGNKQFISRVAANL